MVVFLPLIFVPVKPFRPAVPAVAWFLSSPGHEEQLVLPIACPYNLNVGQATKLLLPYWPSLPVRSGINTARRRDRSDEATTQAVFEKAESGANRLRKSERGSETSEDSHQSTEILYPASKCEEARKVGLLYLPVGIPRLLQLAGRTRVGSTLYVGTLVFSNTAIHWRR